MSFMRMSFKQQEISMPSAMKALRRCLASSDVVFVVQNVKRCVFKCVSCESIWCVVVYVSQDGMWLQVWVYVSVCLCVCVNTVGYSCEKSVYVYVDICIYMYGGMYAFEFSSTSSVYGKNNITASIIKRRDQ